jgi:uncharacterized repeat protein (TIGR01451 family)
MLVAGVVAVPVAQAQTLYSVGCDVPGLISAITSANSSGGGTLDLATGCTYTLASGSYSGPTGTDGLPPITTAVTVHGEGSTITRTPPGSYFRLLEVTGAGSLTADHLSLLDGNDDSSYGGGALSNAGTVTLSDVTVSDNVAQSGIGGGAIYSSGSLTITGSTLSGNNSMMSNGGAVDANGGSLTVINDTLLNNYADASGGAVATDANATLTNDTVADNSTGTNPGAIYRGGGITVSLSNTVLDGNVGGNCPPVSGIFADGGYNLDSDGTCGLHAATDKNDADPQLGSLQANGGPTLTMAPASTSPVVDAIPLGVNGCGTTITTDQRGALRPNGTGCDMGAYEYGDVALQSLTAAPSPVKRKHTLTYTAAVSNAGAADATGVSVTDTVPAGETFKSANVSQGSCSVSAPTVTCTLGQVASATTPTITIVVKVTAKKGKMLTDTATVSATTGDTIPGNDSKTTDVTVS